MRVMHIPAAFCALTFDFCEKYLKKIWNRLLMIGTISWTERFLKECSRIFCG